MSELRRGHRSGSFQVAVWQRSEGIPLGGDRSCDAWSARVDTSLELVTANHSSWEYDRCHGGFQHRDKFDDSPGQVHRTRRHSYDADFFFIVLVAMLRVLRILDMSMITLIFLQCQIEKIEENMERLAGTLSEEENLQKQGEGAKGE